MPRKPLISDDDRINIAIAFRKDPMAISESIRQAASKLSGRELGKSTVQRELAPLRLLYKEGKTARPLDEPWSLATLTKYPVPRDLVPLFLYLAESLGDLGKRLSIRLVIWIGRLHLVGFTTDGHGKELSGEDLGEGDATGEYVKTLDYLSRLLMLATVYATYERASELVGIDTPDTGRFDAETLEGIRENMREYFAHSDPQDELLKRLKRRTRSLERRRK